MLLFITYSADHKEILHMPLLWHVQNFVVTASAHFKSEPCKIWSNFEFGRNTVIGTGQYIKTLASYFLSSMHYQCLHLVSLCDRLTLNRMGHFDGLEQDCSISSMLAMEILQSCTKPPILLQNLFPSACSEQVTTLVILAWYNRHHISVVDADGLGPALPMLKSF